MKRTEKRIGQLIITTVIAMMTLIAIFPAVALTKTPPGPASFPDPLLEQRIRLITGWPFGTIPPVELNRVTNLNISFSDIQSLEGIEHLIALQRLEVSSNSLITDIAPLASLTNLTELRLSGNRIVDISPLANLNQLTHLDLGYNPIEDLTALQNLSDLRFLNVSSTKVNNLAPLRPLNNLTVLQAAHARITDVTPVGTLSGLEQLDLSGNHIEDVTPLASLYGLKDLSLRNNAIVDVSPLGELPRLESLHIDNNLVEDVQPLARMSSLERLYATGNRITNIESVAHIPRLQWADFSGNLIRRVGTWIEKEGAPTLYVAGNPLDLNSLPEDVTARLFGIWRETLYMGPYTIHLYENHQGWFDHMTVWQDDEFVYGHVGYRLHLPDGVPLDVTGDGHEELVVIEFSGGAHCCFTTYVFQTHPEFQLLDTIESEHSHPEFEQVDESQPMTITVNDWTFAYWKAPFVSSPAPEVTLQFDGNRFRVATANMRAPAQSWLELIRAANQVRTHEDWIDYEDDAGTRSNPPSQLWHVMLDLIYTGHRDLAWQFLEDAWPENIVGKQAFARSFVRQLETSPYWLDIWRDMYGGTDELGR